MAEEEKNSSRTLKLKKYRGYLFPDGPLAKDENLKQACQYMPFDDDIILCTYPKTGTTWMTYIIWMILHGAESFPGMRELSKTLAPYLEQYGTSKIEELKPPRFYRTHLPRGLVKINLKAKYIYTYRRPEDTLVSYYYFGKMTETPENDFDDFFESFLEGTVPCGNYLDHLYKYYVHKDDPNFLFVSYENLINDTKNQFLRVANFLGHDYYRDLLGNDVFLEKVLDSTSFGNMKRNLSIPISLSGGKDTAEMFRKGVVGEGKDKLTSEQMSRLRALIIHKLDGTELIDKWLT